jgi:hypothetical protein
MILIIYFYIALFASEILSLLNSFTPKILKIFNISIIILLGIYIIYRKDLFLTSFRKILSEKDTFYLIILSIFPTMSFISGSNIAPNNWDSMTYHFSRFLHWLSNNNLNFFITSNKRENIYPILPDILFAQLFSFFSSDKYLFVLTWLCVVVSAYYIFKITFLLSNNKKASYYASFATIMIPSQVAFMSSTQTDPVSTVLVVILLYYAVLLNSKQSQMLLALILLMVPLFLTTKTTGLILSLPIYLYITYKNWNLIKLNYVRNIFLLFIGIAPAVPYLYRLVSLRQEVVNESVFVENFSISGTFTNMLRIILTQVQTPIPFVNNLLQEAYYSSAKIFSFRANPVGYGSYGDFYLSSSLHGDLTGNPLHVILVLISLFGLISIKKYRSLAILILMQLMLISIFIGWQPWINRFTSTLLTLGSILIGIWISRMKKINIALITCILLLYSSFWLFYNPSRSLLDPKVLVSIGQRWGMNQGNLDKIRHDFVQTKSSQYFSLKPEIEKFYTNALLEIKQRDPKVVYIKISGDEFEYPIWALGDFKYEVKHFSSDKIRNIDSTNALLFCTVDCSSYHLENIYMSEYVNVWTKKTKNNGDTSTK